MLTTAKAEAVGGATVIVAGWTLGHEACRLLSRTQTVVEFDWQLQLVHGSGRKVAPIAKLFLPIWHPPLLAVSFRTPFD